jgi:hypothetical protein
VALVRTDISTEISVLKEPHGITSKKMACFTTVKTSNLTYLVIIKGSDIFWQAGFKNSSKMFLCSRAMKIMFKSTAF